MPSESLSTAKLCAGAVCLFGLGFALGCLRTSAGNTCKNKTPAASNSTAVPTPKAETSAAVTSASAATNSNPIASGERTERVSAFEANTRNGIPNGGNGLDVPFKAAVFQTRQARRQARREEKRLCGEASAREAEAITANEQMMSNSASAVESCQRQYMKSKEAKTNAHAALSNANTGGSSNTCCFRYGFTYDEALSKSRDYTIIHADAMEWLVGKGRLSGGDVLSEERGAGDNAVDASHHASSSSSEGIDDETKSSSPTPLRMLDGSVFTSMPDFSEMSINIEVWRPWFIKAARTILERIPDGQYAVFYQTDVKRIEQVLVSTAATDGVLASADAAIADATPSESLSAHKGGPAKKKIAQLNEWVDKAHMIMTAADQLEGVKLLWHRIFLISDVGGVKVGRPTYSHMICFGKGGAVVSDAANPGLPDVLSRGDMLSIKATGINACVFGALALKLAGVEKVIDPFCGRGTTLLAARLMGMHAVGVDLSKSACSTARKLGTESGFDSFVDIAMKSTFLTAQ